MKTIISCSRRIMTKLGDYEVGTGRYFGAGLPIYHIWYSEDGEKKDINIRAFSNKDACDKFMKGAF